MNKCTCGAEKCGTPHSDWCDNLKEKEVIFNAGSHIISYFSNLPPTKEHFKQGYNTEYLGNGLYKYWKIIQKEKFFIVGDIWPRKAKRDEE
jgi:hypothetical protein